MICVKTVRIDVNDVEREEIEDAIDTISTLRDKLFKAKADIPHTIEILEEAKKILGDIKRGNALS